jgi:hypothetical protein
MRLRDNEHTVKPDERQQDGENPPTRASVDEHRDESHERQADGEDPHMRASNEHGDESESNEREHDGEKRSDGHTYNSSVVDRYILKNVLLEN